MMEGFALRLREESELDGVDRYRSCFLRMIYYANRAKFTGIVDPQCLGMRLTRPLNSLIIRKAQVYAQRLTRSFRVKFSLPHNYTEFVVPTA